MKAPPGFGMIEGMVLKLVKAVYGMKQGDRTWRENIRDTLQLMNSQRTETDYAVFYMKDGALYQCPLCRRHRHILQEPVI